MLEIYLIQIMSYWKDGIVENINEGHGVGVCVNMREITFHNGMPKIMPTTEKPIGGNTCIFKETEARQLNGTEAYVQKDTYKNVHRRSFLWKKTMTNLDSMLKSRDITVPTKVRLVKAMVFPIVMYGCESWTIKKDEHQRMDALELWCWRKLLRVPWTATRSNQSILKEISPEYSLEGLMLKLKLPTLWPPDEKN